MRASTVLIGLRRPPLGVRRSSTSSGSAGGSPATIEFAVILSLRYSARRITSIEHTNNIRMFDRRYPARVPLSCDSTFVSRSERSEREISKLSKMDDVHLLCFDSWLLSLRATSRRGRKIFSCKFGAHGTGCAPRHNWYVRKANVVICKLSNENDDLV